MDCYEPTLLPHSAATSGYGSETDSSFSFNSVSPSGCRCCTLTDPTWQLVGKQSLEPLPVSNRPINYRSTFVKRVIVTMDAQQIGPEDLPHHPLDNTRETIFQRKPWGIAINTRTEQIYVADRQHHKVLVFGADGEYQRSIGGEGTAPGLFNRPTGIAYDVIRNRLIIGDKDNHRVQVLDATTGACHLIIGTPGKKPAHFLFPWGVAISPDGSLIAVSDARNGRVQLFHPNGSYHSCHYLGIDPTSPMMHTRNHKPYPRGLAFDKQGINLYISDFNLHHILRLHIPTRRMSVFVLGLKRPSGIALDNSGNILMCDSRNHHLVAFRPDGHFLGKVSRLGASRIDTPLDVAVFPAGYIALLDFNGRIRVF